MRSKDMTTRKLTLLMVTLVLPAVVAASACGGETAPTAAVVAAGKTTFDQNCSPCHPNGDKGVGPALRGRSVSADTIKATVRSGRERMPAFSLNQISDSQLASLASYVQSLK
jgi:mono/diheme cytochrome c family protein